MKKIDAILLAGEGESSYKVYHQHKAFVRIEDQCIINHVVQSLQKVESIQNIYIVGLKDRLTKTLEEARIDLQSPKPIRIVEQKTNLYENIWATFLDTLPNQGDIPDLESSPYRDKAVLIVPCDAPLITAHEVDYFIRSCDTEHYDHILGLVAKSVLRQFYPRDGKPGIKMSYLHLKENSYRINNLHLVKPLRILNRSYIKEIYQYRYQRNIRNVIPFALKLIGKDKPECFKFYIGLQMSLMFAAMKMERMVDHFRAWVPKKELGQCISRILKTRFMGLEVPFPGAALDIDNDRDYETIKLRFREWRDFLRQLDQTHPFPLIGEYTRLKT
jgi:molybdopterin-guanine dinucleotide biosynthesis protein A